MCSRAAVKVALSPPQALIAGNNDTFLVCVLKHLGHPDVVGQWLVITDDGFPR